MGMESIIGIPLRVVADTLVGFIIFGAVLNVMGGGQFFMDLSMALMGKSRGGPAKVAVVSSGLFGSLSGSVISNVLTTGRLTIPAMQRAGYPAKYAAAVEACASTGGTLMPPVMGAVAFIMASFLDTPYTTIMVAAVVPSVLYYMALVLQVDLYAARNGLIDAQDADHAQPRLLQVIASGWHHILSLAALVSMLFVFSPSRSAYYATALMLVAGLLRHRRLPNFGNALELLEDVTRNISYLIATLCGIGLVVGSLAITGVGIYHLGAGFAGFWSKDAILEVAYGRGTELGNFAFWMGTFAALLTSFYSWRLMFLTFWGKPRWIESEHIQHSVHKTPAEAGEDTTGGYHPHESPLSMLIPLGVLSIGAVLAGQIFAPTFLDDAAFWGSSIFYNEPLIHAMHATPYLVKYAAAIVMLLGLLAAWMAYIRDTSLPAKGAEQLGPVYRFFYNKWYFDELYHYLFIVPAFWLGRQFWKLGDVGTIDRFGPNGIAWVVEKGSVGARMFQTGYLYSYALVMLLGLVAAITWVLF